MLPNRGFVGAHREGEQSSYPDLATIPGHFRQHMREFLLQPPTGQLFNVSTTVDTTYFCGITMCK